MKLIIMYFAILFMVMLMERKVQAQTTACDPAVCTAGCVDCLVDPCVNATCNSFPGAVCTPDYCGGCNAVFSDSNGTLIACLPGTGIVETATANESATVSFVPSESAVESPTVGETNMTINENGTVVETIANENGTVAETMVETSVNGTVAETIIETNVNGTAAETIIETNENITVAESTYPEESGNIITAVPSESEAVQPGCVFLNEYSIPVPSGNCDGNGYCIQGSIDVGLQGCSCFSGWGGNNCTDESPIRGQCLSQRVNVSSSYFDTSIGGYLNGDGMVVLNLTAPLESTALENSNNYASYTTLSFKAQDQCDYPEGRNTHWEKIFGNQCNEVYEGITPVNDLIQCMGGTVFCYDGNSNLIDCLPDLCVTTPCRKCYNGQILATRGYLRTSNSGELSATSTAENRHYFKICLPWIQDVSSHIDLVAVPEFGNNCILIRVAFLCSSSYGDETPDMSCPNGTSHWTIEFLSSAKYPWYVRETNQSSGMLSDGINEYNLTSIDIVSGCNETGAQCIQKLVFHIPGCNTLSNRTVFHFIGLEYDCYGDCADIRIKLSSQLQVQASATLQATQDNCGLDFVVDGTDKFSLEMNTYLDDYVTLNAVFVAADADIGSAYFKILVTSSMNIFTLDLIRLTSQVENGPPTLVPDSSSGYTLQPCPPNATEGDKPSICFSTNVVNLFNGTLNNTGLLTITIHAVVEIDFEVNETNTTGTNSTNSTGTNMRRQVGWASSYDLNSNIHVRPENYESNTASSVSAAVLILALILSYL